MSKLMLRWNIAPHCLCALLGLVACSGGGSSSNDTVADSEGSETSSRPTDSALTSSAAAGSSNGAAGNDVRSGRAATVPAEHLVGTWLFGGSVPNLVTVALTFGADATLRWVEQVAPLTSPAGTSIRPGCTTTDAFSANWLATSDGDSQSLSWTLVDGTANAVTGCGSAPDRGVALTDDALTSYIEQGTVPPRSLTYTVTADTLTINPGVHDAGGLSGETAFIKVIE